MRTNGNDDAYVHRHGHEAAYQVENVARAIRVLVGVVDDASRLVGFHLVAVYHPVEWRMLVTDDIQCAEGVAEGRLLFRTVMHSIAATVCWWALNKA